MEDVNRSRYPPTRILHLGHVMHIKQSERVVEITLANWGHCREQGAVIRISDCNVGITISCVALACCCEVGV